MLHYTQTISCIFHFLMNATARPRSRTVFQIVCYRNTKESVFFWIVCYSYMLLCFWIEYYSYTKDWLLESLLQLHIMNCLSAKVNATATPLFQSFVFCCRYSYTTSRICLLNCLLQLHIDNCSSFYRMNATATPRNLSYNC